MNIREMTDTTRERLLALAVVMGSQKNAVAALESKSLSRSWLLKFISGEISNPTVDKVSALQTAMDRLSSRAA